MGYNQLTYENRIKIQTLFESNYSFSEIARKVKKHPTTVAREIKRNSIDGEYYAHLASKLYCFRKRSNSKPKFCNYELRELVRTLLMIGFSPEQISGRLKLVASEFKSLQVSTETIYKWVYSQMDYGINLIQYLRINNSVNKRKRRKNKQKSRLKRKSIHDRPKIIKYRQRIGDFEGDLIEGKKGSGFIATFVDRKSAFTIAGKLDKNKAQCFNETVVKKFADIDTIHSITYDNGSEMALASNLEEALNCNIYIADPGNPGQRGLNENTNGLLRQYFPKGYDFSKITDKNVEKKVYLLNSRPRKNLNFWTPEEVYYGRFPTVIHPALRY